MGDNLKKAVFICGAGHSGSTLLGLILGSHSDSFYCGEAKNTLFLGNKNKPITKRVCKICGVDCPVWGNFAIDESNLLYEQVSVKTQKTTIVDSTKDTTWIETQLKKLKNTEWQPFLIFLQRDGRAVINSWIRKKPEKDIKEQIIKWIIQIQDTNEMFKSFTYKKIKIRYEELATQPEAVIQRICDFLQVDYQPELLNFYEHNHHPLGGNNGTQFLIANAQNQQINSRVLSLNKSRTNYYENHEFGIALDLRWQRELAPSIERLFEEMAGQENAEMKWEV